MSCPEGKVPKGPSDLDTTCERTEGLPDGNTHCCSASNDSVAVVIGLSVFFGLIVLAICCGYYSAKHRR